MTDLDFSHCNIAMATNESTGRTVVWDRDTDTFGSGFDLPEALHDLADNYNDQYRITVDGEVSDEQLEAIRERMENYDPEV